MPWVEELAADIFMGKFTVKFTRAAMLAGSFLRGSLYERYYGLDYASIDERTNFGALCKWHAGPADDNDYWFVSNGKVIEQSQILTTHNLATLVEAGVEADWAALAKACLRKVFALTAKGNIKDAAYAWRQMLFFATLDGNSQVGHVSEALAGQPEAVRTKLAPVVAGLTEVAAGGTVTKRFLGWG